MVLRWVSFDSGDPANVTRDLKRARDTVGDKLLYFGITPDGVPPPSESFRREILGCLDDIVDQCERIYLVLEGRGFSGSLVRSAVGAMVLLFGRRKEVVTKDTFASALLDAARIHSFDRETLMRYLRAQEVIVD